MRPGWIGQVVRVSAASSGEVAAAGAGADIERVGVSPPSELPGQSFEPAAVDAARAALPGWDVQADVLTRTVTTAHSGQLQAAVREIALRLGRVPDLTALDGQVVIRLPAASGSLDQLVELAGALQPQLTGEAG